MWFSWQKRKAVSRGNEVEVVNSYTYLGYTFTTKLSVCQGFSLLVAKGKKEKKKKKEAIYDSVRVLRYMTLSEFCEILVK